MNDQLKQKIVDDDGDEQTRKCAEAETLKRVAFASVVLSTAAVMAVVMLVPAVYNYVQFVESSLHMELAFCKVRLPLELILPALPSVAHGQPVAGGDTHGHRHPGRRCHGRQSATSDAAGGVRVWPTTTHRWSDHGQTGGDHASGACGHYWCGGNSARCCNHWRTGHCCADRGHHRRARRATSDDW